jgi:hypothetical protein
LAIDDAPRCYDPKSKSFEWYGGRGIGVEKEWHPPETFFADVYPRPAGCSLDRPDVNGNYGPRN